MPFKVSKAYLGLCIFFDYVPDYARLKFLLPLGYIAFPF